MGREKLIMNNIKRDENCTDDFWTLMLEGETEEEFIKRRNDEAKAVLGIDFDYEKIKESKAYKLLFEGFDEWVEEMGSKPRKRDNSDASK